jgi:hypothetical protein
MLSDTVEGIGGLRELTDAFRSKLEKEGFEEIKISGNRSEELPVMHAVDKDNISTATIFKAAKIFIAELTN